jgi:hypothetical protein
LVEAHGVMASEWGGFRRSADGAANQPPTPAPDGAVHVGRGFLSPVAMLKVLGALERLSASWTPSEALGLLGRGQTGQLRAEGLAAQAHLVEIQRALAPAALQWAKTRGFWFARAPHLQLFPVRMVGDPQAPAYQEPHLDSSAGRERPPICTNVFYAKAHDIAGGDLAVATKGGSDLSDPAIVKPSANTIVTFAGDRVHWVEPLYAGERLSVVVNFY